MNKHDLCSLVLDIFASCGTKECSTVIFIGTEEYQNTEECTLFSCSDYNANEKFTLPKCSTNVSLSFAHMEVEPSPFLLAED
jgi:hypothetical protein